MAWNTISIDIIFRLFINIICIFFMGFVEQINFLNKRISKIWTLNKSKKAIKYTDENVMPGNKC